MEDFPFDNPITAAIQEARAKGGLDPGPPSGVILPSRGLDVVEGPKPFEVEAFAPVEHMRTPTVEHPPETSPPDEDVVLLSLATAFWKGYSIHLTADEVRDIEEVVMRGAVRQLDNERQRLENLFPVQKKKRRSRKK